MKLKQLLMIVLLGICQVVKANTSYKRVCYYTNWSQYRKGDGKFTTANIEPGLCTHLIYAFAKLDGNQLATVEANDQQLYKQFNGFKTSNPSLKTSIAVGGWNAGSAPFSAMVATQSSRASFIQSTIKFLRRYGFDGLDIDWEYPAARGGQLKDKANLVLLLKELREAMERESADTGNDKLLISVAVPAGKNKIDGGYDVKAVASNVDFINLMTYDLHGSWDGRTGENSPLFTAKSESGNSAQLNTAWAANYWASQGAPKDKIIVGVSFYGQTFAVDTDVGVGASSSGPGAPGKYTGQAGTMAYYETCKMLETGGTEHWDAEHHVPYYVGGKLWVGYDNVKSVREKAEWIKQEGFGGAMVWALDADDFRKICSSSSHPYPLLSAINDVLHDGTQPAIVDTTTAQMSTTMAPTTAGPTVQSTRTDKQSIARHDETTLKTILETSTIGKSTIVKSTTPAALVTSTGSVDHVSTKKLDIDLTSRKTTDITPTQFSASSTQEMTSSSIKPDAHTITYDVDKASTSKLAVDVSSKKVTDISSTSLLISSTQEPMTSSIKHNAHTTIKRSVDTTSTKKVAVDQTSRKMTNILSTTLLISTLNKTPIHSLSASTSFVPSTESPHSSLTVSPTPPTASVRLSTRPKPAIKLTGFSCSSRDDGFYSEPASCASFYRCVSGATFRFACPPGTVFNRKINVCDWPSNVDCDSKTRGGRK